MKTNSDLVKTIVARWDETHDEQITWAVDIANGGGIYLVAEVDVETRHYGEGDYSSREEWEAKGCPRGREAYDGEVTKQYIDIHGLHIPIEDYEFWSVYRKCDIPDDEAVIETPKESTMDGVFGAMASVFGSGTAA